MASKRIKLGVLFGGVSSEHEISLASAANVIEAARGGNFDVVEIGITKQGHWVIGEGALAYLVSLAESKLLPSGMEKVQADLIKSLGVSSEKGKAPLLKEALNERLSISPSRIPVEVPKRPSIQKLDVIFPLIHGTTGEDGVVQGFLRILDIPFVGCGILASAATMDKITTCQILKAEGIPHARWIALNTVDIEKQIGVLPEKISTELGGFPVFVKPSGTGSSVGISKVKDAQGLKAALIDAAKYDRRLLIEEAIKGRELEIGVLGNYELITSPVVSEIIPGREFYDYTAKYLESDTTKIELPADIPPSMVKRIQEMAKAAFRAVDGCGMARIDFFYKETSDEILLNEINTIPGFTRISQYPALMKTAGFSYLGLIEKLVEIAIERHEENKRLETVASLK